MKNQKRDTGKKGEIKEERENIAIRIRKGKNQGRKR